MDLVVIVFWVAIVVVIFELVIRATRRQRCSQCRSWIDKKATACPRCGRDVRV